jgi:hypothetical protein
MRYTYVNETNRGNDIMTKPNSFAAVTEALAAALAAAPEAERNALAQALESYAGTYHQSYKSLLKVPAVGRMIDAIGESTDARL